MARALWLARLLGDDGEQFAPEEPPTEVLPPVPRPEPLPLAAAEALRADGVPWTEILRRMPGHRHRFVVLGPQVRECLHYLTLRAFCAPADVPAAAKAGAIILLAPPDADAYERLLGIRPLIPEELEQ
jgi:hypothetical protein